MAHAITFIPGDGTGPELAAAARKVLEATGAGLEWDEQTGDGAVASIRRTGTALTGPTSAGAAALCAELGSFASIRPCKAYEGVRTRFPETDVVIVTRLQDDERARRAAADYAREHDRGEVSELEEDAVAGLCCGLLAHPEAYDVISVPALHGDLVAGIGAGMIGGRGVAPGVHLGDGTAVFAATHGCGPGYEGKDQLNPTGLMLSGVLMLRHLGEAEAGDRLEAAIAAVIRRGESVTYDVKPTRNDPSAVGTSEFADAVIQEMNK